MGGGAHRGPVGATRQRRTIRFVQVLLVIVACGLIVFAGYSWGRASGFDEARKADALDAPREPSRVQTLVLALLGAGAIAAAFALQDGSGVRLPTPARLEELAGRAENTAIRRAAGDASADARGSTSGS